MHFPLASIRNLKLNAEKGDKNKGVFQDEPKDLSGWEMCDDLCGWQEVQALCDPRSITTVGLSQAEL